MSKNKVITITNYIIKNIDTIKQGLNECGDDCFDVEYLEEAEVLLGKANKLLISTAETLGLWSPEDNEED